jgi:hypothetical protein
MVAASRARLVGRPFVHPAFDYLLIGGGLSLVVTLVVAAGTRGAAVIGPATLAYVVLATNAAHFASSTVRLYAKPGSFREWPFLTMAFPLVALGLLTVCMFEAERLGPHLQSLYLTWSPYHYAAQAYGIAVLYAMRSGCRLATSHKRLLWWVAMLPFAYNALTAPEVGIHWLLPSAWLAAPGVPGALATLSRGLEAVAIVAPLALFVLVWRSASGPLPLVSLLAIVTNGVWFFVLAPLDAFVWATVFHGVQYLAIVLVFHVRDQMARPERRHGVAYHVAWFYGTSLLLGYGLFNCLPLAYVAVGFGHIEAVLLVVAAINVHHFLVDAYIWRLKKDAGNRRVVESGLPVPA